MIKLLNDKIDAVFRVVNLYGSKNSKIQQPLIIASKKPDNGLYIKENDEEDWSVFNKKIEGFVFEEGYEYEILVAIEPNSNGTREDKISLERILTKTKKQSFDLPN